MSVGCSVLMGEARVWPEPFVDRLRGGRGGADCAGPRLRLISQAQATAAGRAPSLGRAGHGAGADGSVSVLASGRGGKFQAGGVEGRVTHLEYKGEKGSAGPCTHGAGRTGC